MNKLTKQDGSSTKHINQRDEDFILAYFQGYGMRRPETEDIDSNFRLTL